MADQIQTRALIEGMGLKPKVAFGSLGRWNELRSGLIAHIPPLPLVFTSRLALLGFDALKRGKRTTIVRAGFPKTPSAHRGLLPSRRAHFVADDGCQVRADHVAINYLPHPGAPTCKA